MASRAAHIGEIVRRICKRRGITQGDLAILCGTDRTTIARLQNGRTSRRAEKSRWVESIAKSLSSDRIDFSLRLTSEQKDLLIDLADADIHRKEAASRYGWVDPITIRSSKRSRTMSKLVDVLETCGRPAMIIDSLLFIHAMNDLVPTMFGMDPNQWLESWEMWHLIGGKIRQESPARVAYVDDDHLYASVAYFFQRSNSGHYLFTPQMAALLDRLDLLARSSNHPFEHLWGLATSFELPMDLKKMLRIVSHPDGRELLTNIVQTDLVTVSHLPGVETAFAVIEWEAADDAAQQAFAEWNEGARRRVLFEADFDPDGAFHVNNWPEVCKVQRR